MAIHHFYTAIILAFFFLLHCAYASTNGSSSSPDSIFILAGQSNMAGRGGVFCEDRLCLKNCKWDGRIPPESLSNPSILRLTANSIWEEAREPLHWDIDTMKTNGIGPGMVFANQLLIKAPKKVGIVGLVPCAIGGSQLREWIKGTRRYSNLIQRTNASLQFGGNLRGFLWFQGESDAAVKVDSLNYHQNLLNFFNDIRTDLNQPNLPILLVKIANHDLYLSPFINYLDYIRRAEEGVEQEMLGIATVDAVEAIHHVMMDLGQEPYNPDGHLSVHTEVEIGLKLARTFLNFN